MQTQEWTCPDCGTTVEGTSGQILDAKDDHYYEHHLKEHQHE